MKKSLWTRLLSLLLAVVLCVELLPAVGSAVSPSEDLEHTVEGTVEEPAEVAFEEASLRGERVKHFRMGDGSYVAVQAGRPCGTAAVRSSPLPCHLWYSSSACRRHSSTGVTRIWSFSAISVAPMPKVTRRPAS